jgi:hypothetical protein
MNQHLELHFQSESMSDEKVLVHYPAAIRRKVLRQGYGLLCLLHDHICLCKLTLAYNFSCELQKIVDISYMLIDNLSDLFSRMLNAGTCTFSP